MSALSEIIETIRQKQRDGLLCEEIFFRGQREDDKLVPSLLRGNTKFKKPLATTENNFFCDASVMGASYLSKANNSWEALALFQHYEVPTRLLDWSSSLTNALFFALLECLKCEHQGGCNKPRKSCHGNPVLWVLDPHRMHKKLFPRRTIGKMVAVTIGIDDLQDYKNEFVLKQAPDNDWQYKAGPIFLEIPWGDARMRSQKGFFTFHPDNRPLEKLLDENSGLIKISIGKVHRADIVNEFNALGVNEHDIFTDLVSLANYFKRRYMVV